MRKSGLGYGSYRKCSLLIVVILIVFLGSVVIVQGEFLLDKNCPFGKTYYAVARYIGAYGSSQGYNRETGNYPISFWIKTIRSYVNWKCPYVVRYWK